MNKIILCRIFVVSIIFFMSLSTLPVQNVEAQEEYEWISKTPMNVNRYNFRLAVANDKIFAIGGTSSNGTTTLATNEMYDLQTDTWISKAPIPTARSRFAIITCQNKIYAITGISTLANEVYDPTTDTWETKAPLNSQWPRHWINAHTINNKIYVISGLTTELEFWPPNSPEVNIYDPLDDTWSKGKQIPFPVHRYASEVVDNKIYVFGGLDYLRPDKEENGSVYDLVQIYDPSNDMWSFGAPMPVSAYNCHAGATSGLVIPKRIFVLGGLHKDNRINLNQIYDPKTDTWSNGTSLPITFVPSGISRVDDELAAFSLYPSGVVVVDDMLYAISGIENLLYKPLESEIPTPSPTPFSPETEPFPSTIVVASIVTIAIIGIGAFTYFKKNKRN